MDCSLNPDNVLFQVHGPTIIENSVVDGGGETGKTTAAVIQVNDAAVGTGVASLTVRHNTWLHATEQVPVVDAGTPGNPLTTTGGLDTTGQTGKYAIQLFGNVGSDADATTFRILPSFRGDQETLFHCGLVQAAGGPLPAGMSVGYRSETRHTTTRIDVTREALTAAGRSQLFNRFAIPFRSKIVSCIVEVTTAFAVARGIVNLTVTDGVNSGHGNWIEPSNVSITTASRGTPIGALAADLGTVLSGPNYVQGGGAWNLWATAGARVRGPVHDFHRHGGRPEHCDRRRPQRLYHDRVHVVMIGSSPAGRMAATDPVSRAQEGGAVLVGWDVPQMWRCCQDNTM
jgi:hypothetical protein